MQNYISDHHKNKTYLVPSRVKSYHYSEVMIVHKNYLLRTYVRYVDLYSLFVTNVNVIVVDIVPGERDRGPVRQECDPYSCLSQFSYYAQDQSSLAKDRLDLAV